MVQPKLDFLLRISALVALLRLEVAKASGVLEVRVSAFSNAEARDAAGECCQVYQSGPSHWGRRCEGACRTFFRACATVPGREFSDYVHHQGGQGDHHKPDAYSPYRRKVHSPNAHEDDHLHRLVDPNMPCSIGVIVTDVVANNSLEAHDEGILDIKFPFDIPWPSRVGIILEAWHDVTGDLFQHTGLAKVHDKLARLIARVTVVDELEPGKDWSVHWYRNDHIQVDYALRVACKHHYEGPTCSDYQAAATSNKACVCKDDAHHHHSTHSRHKRDVSAPAFSLAPSGNGLDVEDLRWKRAEKQASVEPGPVPQCRGDTGPEIAESVARRLADAFAESLETKTAPPAGADASPVASLMTRLTDAVNRHAEALQGTLHGDVIEGRQMMMRVASMINETVQAINPVLTFMNALVTMLRAARYMLLMVNFVG